jgi:glutaryl-CoA dehydrogenase (non-decarboxylating)
MKLELTDQQIKYQARFHAFAEEEIIPYADQYDQEERIPMQLIRKIGQHGYLGAIIPQKYNGMGMDMISFGLLNEEFGRGCSSVRSLLTVHCMVAQAILKWGTQQQRIAWLPKLAAGETLAAFGLSEPHVGSDAKSLETSATLSGQTYILNGQKKWITYGQIAHLFLVFAQYEGKPVAFLVEKETPGLTIKPIFGMLGTRASLLAELHLQDCPVPKGNILGGIGFGLAAIATTALDLGRYSVAWGSVGAAQACLEASLCYSSERKQFGQAIRNHQLIQQMITEMIVNTKAARLLCYQAGYSKDEGSPQTVMETWIAKYFASKIFAQAASDAVQIHGANGCSSEYSVQRYLRDSKVMEIIEGSTQIQQITIAGYGYQEQNVSSVRPFLTENRQV